MRYLLRRLPIRCLWRGPVSVPSTHKLSTSGYKPTPTPGPILAGAVLYKRRRTRTEAIAGGIGYSHEKRGSGQGVSLYLERCGSARRMRGRAYEWNRRKAIKGSTDGGA